MSNNKEISERRKIVKKLYEEGKTLEEMKQDTGVSFMTLERDITYLRETGQILKSKRKKEKSKIQEEKAQTRRNKVKELYLKGLTQAEIAKKLKIGGNTLGNDIKYLIDSGEIIKQKRKTKSKKAETRRNEIKQLYEDRVTQKEMAEKYKVSVGTIEADIRWLKQHYNLERKKQEKEPEEEKESKTEERIKNRREKVKQLYENGMIQEEIAEKLKVHATTIRKDIKALKEQGIVLTRKTIVRPRKNTKSQEKIKIRREKLVKLYESGMLKKDIAQELKVTTQTIRDDIKALEKQGIVLTRKTKPTSKRMKKRRKKVEKLRKEGESEKDIAEKLNISHKKVMYDIKALEEQENELKRNAEKEKENEIRKLCEDFWGQPKTLDKLKEYILKYKIKFNNKTLKKEELEIIRQIAETTEGFEDGVFYVRACMRFRRIQEAVKFVNNNINNENWDKKQREKMKEMKEKLKYIVKVNAAVIELKNGKGVKQVSHETGLSETDVVKINKQLLQKNNKNSDIKDNDEPKR